MTHSAHEILRRYAGVRFVELHQWSTHDLLDMQECIEEEIRLRAELADEETQIEAGEFD